MLPVLLTLVLAALAAAQDGANGDTFTRSLTTIPGANPSTFEYGPPIWSLTKGATTINGTPFPLDGTSTTSIADLTGTPVDSTTLPAQTSTAAAGSGTVTTTTASSGAAVTATPTSAPTSTHPASSASPAAPQAPSSASPSPAPSSSQCTRLTGTLLALGLVCVAVIVA